MSAETICVSVPESKIQLFSSFFFSKFAFFEIFEAKHEK